MSGSSDGVDRDELFVVEGDDDIVEVTAYCVGCGEEVFNEHMLRDTVEDLDVENPVHDRYECREKGKEAVA